MWREQEMRLLHNQLPLLPTDNDRRRYRKALVVMLYAHFEGGTRTILQTYADAVNNLGHTVGEANYALAAAVLSDVFKALNDGDRKCKVFARGLPDDQKLHRFARQRDFLEEIEGFEERHVSINPDEIVNTESNLKPLVLRKILYRLGLDPELVLNWSPVIDELLQRRNDVAHGMKKDGLEDRDYSRLEKAVREVTDNIVAAVTAALRARAYLRVPP